MELSKIRDADLFSISRLAELFGHTRETISKKLNEAGTKPSGKKSGYPAYKIKDVAVFTGGYTAPEPTNENGIDPDKMPPKDRDAWFSSENKRLQFQKKEGELLDREETRLKTADAFKKVTLMLDTLGDVLERDVGLNAEQIAKVNSIADNLREDLVENILEGLRDGSSEY